MASAALELLIQLKDEASAGLSAITGSLGGVGNAALAVAGGGLLAIGGGLTAAIGAGLSFNNSMEQVSAQLMAFTKDGAQTAAILDMIKERAASTPFAFEDMATAATALLPASKAAGVGLEELIAQAEILAASNPAEGLEGAAFALKEAVGGDFASAIERFNLPRQYINQLKEEGVPNLEILSRAMGQLGLDADLVSGLANTASGRWSTFLDTLTNVAAAVSQPIFEAFSSGLAGVQTVLDANMPAITAFAGVISGQLAGAIQGIIGTLGDWAQSFSEGGISGLLNNIIYSLTGIPMAAGPVVAAFESIGATLSDWMQSFSEGGISGLLNNLIYSLTGIPMAAGPVIAAFQSVLAAVQPLLPSLGDVLMPILVGLAAVIGGGIVVALGSMVAAAAAAAAPILALVAAGAALYAAWSSNFLGIRDIVTGALSAVLGVVTSVAGQIVALGTAAALLYQAWATNFGGIQQIIQPVIDAVTQGFGEGGILGAINGLLTGLTAAWPAIVEWFAMAGTTIATHLMTWGQAFVDWIAPYIPIALEYLQTFVAGIWAWIVEQAPGLAAQVLTWGQAFVEWITPYISIALAYLGEFISAVWAWIVEQAPGILDKVMAWGQALIEWIAPYIPEVLSALGELASSFLSWIGEQAGPILEKLGVWATALVEWIVPATVEFLAAWPGMLSSFLDWIANAVGPIAAGLVDWALEMVAWVAPMIPDLLVAIAGIAAALLTFIAETAIVLVPKLVAWAGAFLGWVATDVLPKIAGILGDILTRIEEWIGTAVDWILDKAASLGKAMIDGAVKGIKDAGSALLDAMTGMATSALNAAKSALGIKSPSKVMAAEVGAPIVDGIVAGLVQRSPKAVQAMLDLASSMFEVVNKGVEAFGKLTQLGTIPQSAIANFGDAIQRTLTEFSQRVGQWDKAAMSAASQFTYKAGQVVDFLAKGVELLNGIAALAVPSQNAIRAFADSLAMVMSEIVRVSTFELRLGLTAGVEFASGAKAIAEMIAKGVEALNALSDFVRPAPGVIQQFADVMYWLVSRFVLVGGWFDGQALGAATAFAAAADTIFKVVAGGVDAMLKLAEFVRPAPGVIGTFVDVLAWLISRFVLVGQWFNGPALAAGTAFAEAAGKVVGVVSAAVDGLLKLAEFVRPAPGVIQEFTNVVWWLVSRFAEAATWMSSKALAAAVAFAEGAGKAVGVIGGAVDALGKLSTFVAPLEENVSAFFRSLADFLEKMGSWSANFEADMLEATGIFAAGIQKSVAGIGAAADALGKLVDFVAPAEANVSAFFRSLADLLEKMGVWSANFEADMLEATAVFAAGINQAVAPLKGAIESLAKFTDFVPPAQKGVSAFFQSVAALLTQMGVLAAQYSAEFFAGTILFGQNIAKSVESIKAAFAQMAGLADLKGIASGVLDSFTKNLTALLDELERQVAPAAENIGAALVYGIADGITAQLPYLVATLQNAAYTMVDTVNSALGIASPSKVFEQIGQYAGEGMAGGMAAMQPAIAGAGAGLGMAAAGGASGAASSGRGGGGEGLTINIGSGAIVLNGVQGGIGEKELRRLAQLIKEEIANERGGR